MFSILSLLVCFLQLFSQSFDTGDFELIISRCDSFFFLTGSYMCHCELAGEGVEYAWGCANIHYQRQPLKDKRGKENFRQTVRKCFSRDILTIEQVHMFSQCARAYILACHMIRQEQLTDSASMMTNLNSTVSPVKVEKVLKTFNTHRCAMDFNSAFCRAVFNGENSSSASVSL